MTKKDYKLLAGAIHEAYTDLMYASTNPGETKRSAQIIAAVIGGKLQEENPRFIPNRFYEACNIQ